MELTIRSAIVATVMTAILGFTIASNTKAESLRLPAKTSELAYAPQPAPDTRFDQLETEDYMHELNDAWLGMPAHASDGELIGFVEDAYLDEFGNVTELLVSLRKRNFAVFVDGTHTTLSDTQVAIALTGNQIASLERAEGFQLVQR